MRMHHWLYAALMSSALCPMSTGHAQSAPKASTNTLQLEPVAVLRTKRLDLRPPKITELFSEETIERALRQARDARTIEEIEVEGRRESAPPRTPDIPGGILAPFWALANPTQSWRILLPLAPDQAEKRNGPPPSATDPYRPVMLGPAFGN